MKDGAFWEAFLVWTGSRLNSFDLFMVPGCFCFASWLPASLLRPVAKAQSHGFPNASVAFHCSTAV